MFLKQYVRIMSILSSRKGQGLVEYGLLVVLIAIGLIATVVAFRGSIVNKFGEISNAIAAAT
jgi:Flp pilus assembly pilin Flp